MPESSPKTGNDLLPELEEHPARLQEMVAAATGREETLRKRVKKLRARLGEADD
ncbi:hypothetical protein [Nocardioides sp. InS609-2]|uniref:hypothetical protein n=1 Tax=Nocardioides sp. InS609-2 TaxID=2760705 RepID=UPI0020BF06CB|nr:hypothetical protein [Nocardioides sp. InS609-2]